MAFATTSKRYPVRGGAFFKDLILPDFSNLKLYVNESEFLTFELLNHFEGYLIPMINTNEDVARYHVEPLKFYQNQINFVVWCATSGCGVSYQHFNNPNVLLSSFYGFHVYYQTRRLLKELASPTSKENFWEPVNNNIDHEAYLKICREFHIDPNSDWRQK